MNGLGFPGVGYDAQDRARLHDLSDRHRDRPGWHVVNRREPALTYLLAPARLVKGNDKVRSRVRKISRRIIEGKVAVFANSDTRDVDGS